MAKELTFDETDALKEKQRRTGTKVVARVADDERAYRGISIFIDERVSPGYGGRYYTRLHGKRISRTTLREIKTEIDDHLDDMGNA